MNDYLMDRETLGKFVDELIKRKTLPVNTPEELSALRENSMKELDDRIASALFGNLTDEQAASLDQLLDHDDGTADPYLDFFKNIGLDVEQTTTEVAQAYAAEFLAAEGDQNA